MRAPRRLDVMARDAHRDTLHEAFGGPLIRPSMLNAIERAFEGIEESQFDNGMAYYRDTCTEKLLMKVLDVLEEESTKGIFDREKWVRALTIAVQRQKDEQDIPF